MMQGQIRSRSSKKKRQTDRTGEKNRRAYEESFLGKTVEVLVEEKSDVNGKEMWTGHTKEYMKIALESEKNLQNCILNVQIKEWPGNYSLNFKIDYIRMISRILTQLC